MKFISRTNWSLLKKQKETLVELSGAQTALSPEMKADLAGLLHFLDAVMDDAAEIIGEAVVFPGLDQEEGIAVEFTSVWDGGASAVRTPGRYYPTTGRIEVLQTAEVEGLEGLDEEYINLPEGKRRQVCTVCHEYALGEDEKCLSPDCANGLQRAVIITITGGAVRDVKAPPGIRVIIRDYDVESDDGEDCDIRKDEDGDQYQQMEF